MVNISYVLGKTKSNSFLLTEEERGILALYGAAYKVAFERLAPDAVDPGTWSALEATAHSMREWAANLEDEQLREVYARAIDDVVERGAGVVENTRRSLRMISLYSEIPKPP